MSAEVQQEIWVVPFNEEQHMWQEIFLLKKKQDHLRRGVLQRYGDLKKEVALLHDELADLRGEKQDRVVILTA